MSDLETPASAQELYLARGQECDEFALRPTFTGDLFSVDGTNCTLVQHPCAIRRGTKLAPRLLVAQVDKYDTPADWAAGNYKRGFFPQIGGLDLSARFDDLDVVDSDIMKDAQRIAILSAYGVNLLVQRWIYHCSRVAIRTPRIAEQTIGPFEEADLTGEAMQLLADAGVASERAIIDVDAWFGQGSPPQRERLRSSQQRSSVRRELLRWAKNRAEHG